MRRRARRFASAPALTVLLASVVSCTSAVSIARADEDEAPKSGPVYLVWTAPIECPRQPEISAEIDRLIGAQPRRSREGVEVRARVVRLEAAEPNVAWHAEVAIASAGDVESRTVSGESCASVAHAVAVMAAIASDASSPGERQRRFFGAVSGEVDVGTLPHVAAGVAFGLGYRGRAVELGVVGALFVPQHAEAPRAGAGADFALVRFGAHGCGFVSFDRFTVGPCAQLGLDAVRAQGTGSDRPSNVSSAAVTVGAELLGRLQIAPAFAVRAAVGLAAPLGRPTFVVAGGGAVHRASAVTVPLALGAELDF